MREHVLSVKFINLYIFILIKMSKFHPIAELRFCCRKQMVVIKNINLIQMIYEKKKLNSNEIKSRLMG